MARDIVQLPTPSNTSGDKKDSYSFTGAGGATVKAEAVVLVDVNGNPITVKAANTPAAATDVPLVAALHPVSPLPAGTNTIGTVRWATDTGRQYVTLFASAVASVTAEAMVSLTGNRQGTAIAAATSYTVPTGKTLRLQAIRLRANFATMSTTVTFANTSIRLRAGNAVTSPLIWQTRLDAASNAPGPEAEVMIPDGMDFAAGSIIGISHLGSATTLVQDVMLIGFEY